MKDSTIVNGVTLTRQQVEEALKDLNTPQFEPGDLVEIITSGKKALVCGSALLERLDRVFGMKSKELGWLRLVFIDGCETAAAWAYQLRLVKKGPIA